jgi:hypothetical protein
VWKKSAADTARAQSQICISASAERICRSAAFIKSTFIAHSDNNYDGFGFVIYCSAQIVQLDA